MLYLPFIISNILSAAVSAAVTVYLLRYFILKHKDEFFGDFKVNQDTKELRNDTTIVERSPDISKKDEGQVKSIEENILSSFTQVHQESKRVRLNRFSNVFTTLTDFFSNTFKNLNFQIQQ